MRPVRPHLEVIDFDRIEWMRMGFFVRNRESDEGFQK